MSRQNWEGINLKLEELLKRKEILLGLVILSWGLIMVTSYFLYSEPKASDEQAEVDPFPHPPKPYFPPGPEPLPPNPNPKPVPPDPTPPKPVPPAPTPTPVPPSPKPIPPAPPEPEVIVTSLCKQGWILMRMSLQGDRNYFTDHAARCLWCNQLLQDELCNEGRSLLNENSQEDRSSKFREHAKNCYKCRPYVFDPPE